MAKDDVEAPDLLDDAPSPRDKLVYTRIIRIVDHLTATNNG